MLSNPAKKFADAIAGWTGERVKRSLEMSDGGSVADLAALAGRRWLGWCDEAASIA